MQLFFFTDKDSVHMFRVKAIIENGTFWKRSPEWNILKTLFCCIRVNGWKGNFSKTPTPYYWFQSKMYELLVFNARLIFCFQGTSAPLNPKVEFSRRSDHMELLPLLSSFDLSLFLTWFKNISNHSVATYKSPFCGKKEDNTKRLHGMKYNIMRAKHVTPLGNGKQREITLS